jgi:hypothetical protein
MSLSYYPVNFQDWEDFLVLAREIRPEDLVVFASSRKGSVSHQPILENIPMKLEKHFQKNSKIVVYPHQYVSHQYTEIFDDIPSGPLTKGIETIERGIGSIFKRGEN